ncbi:hypothetical protein [Acidovorax sp.]|uniref:hypothetical protein n=1 Tax=Acidovorax sp. TaxID=1872122 RepID=UPI004037BF19
MASVLYSMGDCADRRKAKSFKRVLSDGYAVLGLGDVARTCVALDTEDAVANIARALTDKNEFPQGQAQCAAEDIETYLGIKVTGDR